MPNVILNAADFAATLAAARWWEITNLRRLLGRQPATILGHDAGPDPAAPSYAFLAADLKTVRRFFVVLRDTGLLSLDLAAGSAPVSWRLEGNPGPRYVHRSLRTGQSNAVLNAVVSPGVVLEPIQSMDLAGARVGDDVILFHTETGMATSALFYDVPGKGTVRILIVGLSPGFWEVWKDGFLEDNAHQVRPDRGTLSYGGEAGGYFLRQR